MQLEVHGYYLLATTTRIRGELARGNAVVSVQTEEKVNFSRLNIDRTFFQYCFL